MPVTDEQEATLHAQLARRFEEHGRRLEALDPVAARTGYSALVSAAFGIAASARFPEGTPKSEVIEYVSDVRTRGGGITIDPRIAERVILAVCSDEEINDIDAKASFEVQLVLLAALIADADFDDADLDVFMRRARKMADSWLA